MHLSGAEISEALNIRRTPRRNELNILKKDEFVTITFRKRASVSGSSNRL